MNKAKKYKLKLDYTEEELKELKGLRKHYSSPMTALWRVVGDCGGSLRSLQRKHRMLDPHNEFDFMADINNVVMGTAIFPEKEYVVHDKVTDQYIYYNTLQGDLRWWQLGAGTAEKKTKKEWLAINPSYEPMLEEAEE